MGLVQGQVSDLQIQAKEIGRVRQQMVTALSEHTGRSKEQVYADVEREQIFNAEEAKEYGFVDDVPRYRKLDKSSLLPSAGSLP